MCWKVPEKKEYGMVFLTEHRKDGSKKIYEHDQVDVPTTYCVTCEIGFYFKFHR